MNIKEIEKLNNSHIVYFYNNIKLGEKSIIDNETVEILYDVFKNLREYDRINLFLESGGGNLASGARLIHIIRELYKEFYVTVLNRVNSTASMIALSSDKLFILPKTLITPFEPQMNIQDEKISVSVIRNILDNVNGDNLYKNLDLITLGKYYASINYFKDLVYSINSQEKALKIIDYMLNKVNSHQYPITVKELKSLGIQVSFLDEELSKSYLSIEKNIKNLFIDKQNGDTINVYSTIIEDREKVTAYTKTYKLQNNQYQKIYEGYKTL